MQVTLLFYIPSVSRLQHLLAKVINVDLKFSLYLTFRGILFIPMYTLGERVIVIYLQNVKAPFLHVFYLC